MAKYATSEHMYQCSAVRCKIWFSDREGIKVSIPSRRLKKAFGDLKTHIGCPKCAVERPNTSHSVHVRHAGIVPVLDDLEKDWVLHQTDGFRQRLDNG